MHFYADYSLWKIMTIKTITFLKMKRREVELNFTHNTKIKNNLTHHQQKEIRSNKNIKMKGNFDFTFSIRTFTEIFASLMNCSMLQQEQQL